MKTAAIPCNGVIECDQAVDETWICEDSKIAFYGVITSCIVILIIMTIFKWQRRLLGIVANRNDRTEVSFEIGTQLKEEWLSRHDDEEFRKKLNFYILRSNILDKEYLRIEKSTWIYENELNYHKQSNQDTLCCLKNMFSAPILKIILDDVNPGCMR